MYQTLSSNAAGPDPDIALGDFPVYEQHSYCWILTLDFSDTSTSPFVINRDTASIPGRTLLSRLTTCLAGFHGLSFNVYSFHIQSEILSLRSPSTHA